MWFRVKVQVHFRRQDFRQSPVEVEVDVQALAIVSHGMQLFSRCDRNGEDGGQLRRRFDD